MAYKFSFKQTGTQITATKNWTGSVSGQVTTTTVYGGGQSLPNENIYFAIPTTPGINPAIGDVSYKPSPGTQITDLEKKALVAAYKNQKDAADIVFALWESQAKIMSFSLKNNQIGTATWIWTNGAPDGVANGLKKINDLTEDLNNYTNQQFHTTYEDVAPTPSQYYRPVVLAITNISQDDPTPPPDKPDDPVVSDSCKVCSGPSDTSIASCIHATSQSFLDGIERDFRLDSVTVNSLNA